MIYEQEGEGYDDNFSFLLNTYLADIEIDGRRWKSVENFY
jgi:hypothetical protein